MDGPLLPGQQIHRSWKEPEMRSRCVTVGALTALLMLSLGAPAYGVPNDESADVLRYHEIVLGTLPGFIHSEATAINDRGQVVGSSSTPFQGARAFIWHRGVMRDLGTLSPSPNDIATAHDINDHGDVVGASRAGESPHATLWQSGTARDLGTLGGTFSSAMAINNHRQVVGFSTTATGETHSFLWQHGVMTDLGLPGAFIARDINDRGYVLITGTTLNETEKVLLWRNGVVAEISATIAYHVNNRNEVVGYDQPGTVPPTGLAYLWQRGVRTNLPTFPGATNSAGNAINNHGDIVGFSNTAQPNDYHSVMWLDGTLVDLASHGVRESVMIIGINDRRQLTGTRSLGEGHIVAVVYQ